MLYHVLYNISSNMALNFLPISTRLAYNTLGLVL